MSIAIIPNPIVQQYIQGTHYTVDIFCDQQGKPMCIVPRRRVKVIGSCTVIGKIDMNPDIIDLVKRVAVALECVGLMNLQLIRKTDGALVVHDINPRLASGAVLSIKAGAPFPRWIIEMLTSGISDPSFEIEDGLVMARHYSEEFWLSEVLSERLDNNLS